MWMSGTGYSVAKVYWTDTDGKFTTQQSTAAKLVARTYTPLAILSPNKR
jgi:hypothetical protein